MAKQKYWFKVFVYVLIALISELLFSYNSFSRSGLFRFSFLRLAVCLCIVIVLYTKHRAIQNNIKAFALRALNFLQNNTVCFLAVNFAYGMFIAGLFLITHNTPYYGYCVFFLCGLIFINALLLYFHKVIASFETLFFICSSCVVIAAILSSPLYANSGDASKHFSRCIALSDVYTNANFPTFATNADFSVKQLKNHIRVATDSFLNNPITSSTSMFSLLSYRYVAYIPFCIGLLFADAMGAFPTQAYYAGVICNALFLLYVCTSAIKKLESGKLIFALFILFPSSIRLLRMYSYSSWVTVFLSYGSASVIGAIQKQEPLTMRQLFSILISFLLAIMVKPPYFLMLAIAFIMPVYCFENPKQKRRYAIIIVLAMCFSLLLIILPALISDVGFELYSDLRGGTEVSATGQLKHILTHPVQYTAILLKTLFKQLSPYNIFFGKEGMCGFTAGKLCTFSTIFPFTFVLAMLLDHKKYDRIINAKYQFYFFVIVLLNSCIIATTMYMNYSNVGSSDFSGLNTLYLLAAFSPIFQVASTKRITHNIQIRYLNVFLFGAVCCALFLNIYFDIILHIL